MITSEIIKCINWDETLKCIKIIENFLPWLLFIYGFGGELPDQDCLNNGIDVLGIGIESVNKLLLSCMPKIWTNNNNRNSTRATCQYHVTLIKEARICCIELKENYFVSAFHTDQNSSTTSNFQIYHNK